ncbi:aldose 1-epimerase [Kordia sp.]|uniref:aldose 1-epimerase n=1 Tax=Kordia sp. TaxID=1965332 RepID=UPI0025BEDE26|nr:aldose 1-epimerase [Kordia sp.]MCH2196245.1 aldose 1-epimerase [Kordia sp.]
MFQIQEKNNIIEILSDHMKASASINLDEGARLFDLRLNDRTIISEYENFPYNHSSASAILFPFANRIEDGTYTFEGETYQIPCNEPEKNNAIHGLLYTRTFEVYEQKIFSSATIITLRYQHDGTSQGFPFPFDFYITYTFAETELNVKMKVVNTGTKTFPFTIGWHPYFNSENLYESTIDFNGEEEYTTTDDRSLTNGTKPHELRMPFQLKNHPFDTAYKMLDDTIGFKTPTYKLKITGNAKKNYVQFYTPKDKSIIAIEPTVGLSNSFNNGIGLQTLAPNKTYEIAWNVVVEKL